MSISQNFPDLTPSLNLNFAGSKKLDSRITFTRGSTGTYMDDNGIIKTAGINQPRFDHSFNGTSIESLGLLIEESRTNLLVQSESLNTTWTLGGVTISANTTATTAPDGTTNSDKIQEDNTNGQHLVYQFLGTLSIGAVYTFSCFFKAAERTEISLTGHGEGYSVFNLSNGTVTATGGNSNVSITPYPNGWYRCSTTITKTNTNGNFYIVGWNNGSNVYTGTTGSGVYAWGAQIELGSFGTSYIPTVASTVTRSADNASITGTNFSSWYNPNEWTLITNTSVPRSNLISAPSEAQSIAIDDGTTNNLYTIRYVTDTTSPYIDGYANASGIQTFDFIGSMTLSFPNPVKSALAVKSNDAAFSYNGNTVEIDNIVTLSTALNRLQISGGNLKAGTIAQISYYPKRLTNSQLQNLTR